MQAKSDGGTYGDNRRAAAPPFAGPAVTGGGTDFAPAVAPAVASVCESVTRVCEYVSLRGSDAAREREDAAQLLRLRGKPRTVRSARNQRPTIRRTRATQPPTEKERFPSTIANSSSLD